MTQKQRSLKLSPEEIASAFSRDDGSTLYPPILTIDQAAELLQVPKATVYDWSSRGHLNGCSRRVGKYLRFWRDRLIDSIFNQETTNHV